MPHTLGDLATLVGGELVGGEATLSIATAATLETATPRDITLVDSADKLHLLAKSAAAAAIARARSTGLVSKWPTSTPPSPPRSIASVRRGPPPAGA